MHPTKSDWLTKKQMDPKVLDIPLELPDAQEVGDLRVTKFTVKPEEERKETQRFMDMLTIHNFGPPKPWDEIECFRQPWHMKEGDILTRAYHGETMWMSDSPQERFMMEFAAREAKGNVLVGGCGLGIYVQYALRNPAVENVIVVDINPDVIKLAKSMEWAKDPRVHTFHEMDIGVALERTKSTRGLDTIYLDVHDKISPDYLPYLNSLRERARKALTTQANRGHGRVYIWAHKKILSMARRDFRDTLKMVSERGFEDEVHRAGFDQRFPIEGLLLHELEKKGVLPRVGVHHQFMQKAVGMRGAVEDKKFIKQFAENIKLKANGASTLNINDKDFEVRS